MKKIVRFSVITLFIILMSGPSVLRAQGKFELSPFGGYMFGGSLNMYQGKFKINNNANYGLALDIEVARDTKLELFWTQMNTTAQFNPYYGYDYLALSSFNINVGYIQIGSVRELEVDNDQIKPFGVFTIGTTYFMPKDATFSTSSQYPSGATLDDVWKFSVTLGGGVKIFLSDRVGIRLQGNLMLPMFWAGAGFTVGTGGSGVSVGAGTSMIQGDFTGGLIFALGK